MRKELKSFAEKYNAALQSYLAHGQEANLERAYDLGRKAVANGLGLLKLTKLHLDAVGEIVCARPQLTNDGDTSRAAQTFLLEALSPFEATHRGFRETNRKLLQLNKTLSRRNTELGMMNRSLKNEVLERKRTEKALRESEEHYRILFSEARQMQENLRHLSSQILHVQEEERKRISRELHDEVGQSLTAINMHLAMLQKAANALESSVKKKIADTQRLLEQTMDTVHQFSRELRPAMLDDLGLIPALRAYVRAFAERSSVRASFRSCRGVEQLGTEQKLVLYRVAQESLTNVAKHARATAVLLKLRNLKAAIGMEIKDNGRAFAADRQIAANGKKRLGLLGMRERIRLVQGQFSVQSKPGEGTTIRVQIPFRMEN